MLVSIHKQLIFPVLIFLLSFPVNAQEKEWSLEECIDTAFVRNKNLLIAQNQLEIAELRNQEAKANLIPKLMVQGDYKYFSDLPYQLLPNVAFGGIEGTYKEIQFGVPHNIGASLSFKMPIYDPQIMGSIQVSETYQELSLLQQSKTKEQVYLEISGLYYNAQILKNRLDFLRKNLINSQRLHKNTELLYDQKLAMRTDLDKVTLQIQQLEMQVFQAESQYNTILKGLKFAMGLPLDTELEIPTAIAQVEETNWETKSTLDYQIQESRYKIVNHELRTLKNSRIPSLSLLGNYGATGFGYTGDPEAFLDFYRVSFVGAQVSFPLFNGTVTQKKIRQKEIELATSQVQKDLVADQTLLQTQTALMQQSVSARQLETSKSQIELAESVYNRTLLQQQEKMASLTEVLLADNALRDSQQQYLNAMVDYLKATLELKKSSGNILN